MLSQAHIMKKRENTLMKAYYADHFVLPLPVGHRFPMEKYRLLREIIEDMPGIELIEAPLASDDDLARAHSHSYIERVSLGLLSDSELREIGFPWSLLMVERSKRSAGATVGACMSALRDGIAVNLAGGTHHAYADKGSGFCVFNDAVVAARYFQHQQNGQGKQKPAIAIIDLDVHQGNGTASICQGDSSIFTLSIHGDKNFPFRKESSSLDIGLPDGSGDDAYLKVLSDALHTLETRFTPEMIIYLAGADPHEGDRLGRLSLTMDGMAYRDQMVLNFAQDMSCPIALAMAGGYGRQIETTVEVHAQTIQLALNYYKKRKETFA
jgi:acetoin utilization deacetylase AcuC-like enzyme